MQIASSHSKLKTCIGAPFPYGATRYHDNWVNFAIFSDSTDFFTLCLFEKGAEKAKYSFKLDPKINKTGNVWHIEISNIGNLQEYGYLVNDSKLLIDPYAKALTGPSIWAEHKLQLKQRSYIPHEKHFDWENDRHLNRPLQEMIIYEMHVRGFTQDPSSKVQESCRGTFKGLIDKIPYLKDLGVNTIELMPIMEFNELEYSRKNPKTGNLLCNYWGYSPINFFAPMIRYQSGETPEEAISEIKELVKSLHKNNLEVILDVVFNHTAEGNELGPCLSFKGLSNQTYYLLNEHGAYHNYSGCGNTMNCNHPVVRELIHDCLRYWVTEMHIDGFRFDLASILGRSSTGEPLSNPPLLEQIALDPLLAKTKLIAEAWDAAGLYQVGTFPSWGVWAEWNGKYRDTLRRFMRGDASATADFATRLCGSSDLYNNGRTPSHSINFVTAHDGFSLYDLISYQKKHNLANGEDNKDGENHNESWNCGVEGETSNLEIIKLRQRQMRNFIVALMVSQGVPMLHMGDEYGHSKNGNNNTWCQDNALNWFQWDLLKKNQDFYQFTKGMIHFRHQNPLVRQNHFLSPSTISWYDNCGEKFNWEESKGFLAFSLNENKQNYNPQLFIAFNSKETPCKLCLLKNFKGKKIFRIVDTSLEDKKSFNDKGILLKKMTYDLKSFSSVIFRIEN